MGNLVGVLFSFLMIIPVIVLGIDLYGLTSEQVALETMATIISYRISKEGGVRQQLISELASEGVELICLSTCHNVSVGQIVKYQLFDYYTPILISENDISVSVTRTTMIGYL